MMCSTTNHCPQQCRGTLKLQQRPLDVKVPANHLYINDAQDFSGGSYVRTPSQVSAKMKFDVHEHKVSSMVGLKLSLSVDSDSWLQEVEQCQGEYLYKNMSTGRTLFACGEVGELDLNKVAVPDESYVHSIDHWNWISNPSNCTTPSDVSLNEGKTTFFNFVDWREPNNDFSSEASALDQQEDITSSTLATSRSKDTTGEKTRQKITMSELNVKKSKEEKLYTNYLNQQLLEAGTDSSRSPVPCKSDLITDDLSSNSKTGQCGIDKSNSNVKSQPLDEKKKELAEADVVVKRGAVSLICFSLEPSSGNQEDIPEAKRIKESCTTEREAPQSSSESYEAIVLKQAESSVDEYCVSSTPLEEVSGLDEKKHGLKLKRGRRMKDFRKEILPGLASLSREEICEDIKIMELAIRPRQYKKYRSKMAT